MIAYDDIVKTFDDDKINLICLGADGYGDFIHYLSIATEHQKIHNKPVKLSVLWPYSNTCTHHPDDVEYGWEVMDYVNSRFKYPVEIVHYFDSPGFVWDVEGNNVDQSYMLGIIAWWMILTEDQLEFFMSQEGLMHFKSITPYGVEIAAGEPVGFDLDNQVFSRYTPIISNQVDHNIKTVVYWTGLENLNEASQWKSIQGKQSWNKLITRFKSEGYTPIELTYRTPVREAFYHISNASLIACYDGMWHRISTYMLKPTLLITKGFLGIVNTFNAYQVESIDEAMLIKDIQGCCDEANNKAVARVNDMMYNNINLITNNPLVDDKLFKKYSNRQIV
jgi:hypothetical protein